LQREIIWSARASRDGHTVRPSAFAVFVGHSIERSYGFAFLNLIRILRRGESFHAGRSVAHEAAVPGGLADKKDGRQPPLEPGISERGMLHKQEIASPMVLANPAMSGVSSVRA
jgi:hypothetical protein